LTLSIIIRTYDTNNALSTSLVKVDLFTKMTSNTDNKYHM